MYEDTNKKQRNIKGLIFKIIIIVLVLLIGFFLFKSLIDKDDKTTTKGQTFAENFKNLKKVAEKYYTDDKLPKEIGKTNKVTLKELIEKDYIDKVIDNKGKSCSTANSYAEMKKTTENKYSLKVQLTCDDEQNYIISTITKEVEQDDDVEVTVDNNASENSENTENTQTETEQNVETPDTNQNTTQENKSSVSSTKIPTINNNTTTKKSTSSTTNKNTTTNNNTSTNNNTNSNQNTTTPNKVEPEKNIYYVVTFNPKGCKEVPLPQNIKKGSVAKRPADPVKKGYKFLGWYYNNKLFDFNTPINQSYNLEAKWQKI